MSPPTSSPTWTGATADGRTDQQLWTRLTARDPEAIGPLFDRHQHAVYNFGFRRTASWSTAEEVVQSTFTTTWRRAVQLTLPPLDHPSALPWLLGVADNECRNATRLRHRVDRRTARVGLPLPAPDHADDVAARIDDERRMREVRRALDQLPAHERLAIELSLWSGLSIAETAAVLQVAEGTVKSRLSRARTRLAGLLRPTDQLEDLR